MKVYALLERTTAGEIDIVKVYSTVQTAKENSKVVGRVWLGHNDKSKEDKCLEYTRSVVGKSDFYIDEYEVY